MVAFLVQFSSQHKPVPTNQPLSTFGHLHLSKATNSRNNPIPANAVEAKKQVGPPSAITLGYVRTFIRTGIFIGRRSVPQPVYRLQVNRPRLCLLCLQLRAKVQELELISKSEVNQNIESPINYHTWSASGKKHMIWAMVTPYGTRIAKWMIFVENWLKMESHFLLTWNWKPFIWIFYRCKIYVYMLVGSISFVY